MSPPEPVYSADPVGKLQFARFPEAQIHKIIDRMEADGAAQRRWHLESDLCRAFCTALTRYLASVIWESIHRVVFNGIAAPRPKSRLRSPAACAKQSS
jgi:hypothetical protein